MYWQISPYGRPRVGILVESPLPHRRTATMVGMSKISSSLKLMGNALVAGKLQTIIEGDRLDGQATPTQSLGGCPSQGTGLFRA